MTILQKKALLMWRCEKITDESLQKIKNYEIAISKYKKAQELYNHPEVTLKLDKAIELYAPILEKRKEEENLPLILYYAVGKWVSSAVLVAASVKNGGNEPLT